MSNSSDEDDWSNDSASLFRVARRAHDPTPAESARLAAVLTRIQTTQTSNVEASLTGDIGAGLVARGAKSALLRLIASVSIGVMCIAAASFAYLRVDHRASTPARDLKPLPALVVSTRQAVVAPPAEVANAELREAANDEVQSRPASPRRRARATGEKQQRSRNEVPSAVEGSKTAIVDRGGSEAMTVPANSVTTEARASEVVAAAKPAAKVQETVSRVAAAEPTPTESTAAVARDAEPKLPAHAPTELAIMKRMQSALREADFAAVLSLCAEHARRWPHGVFEVEREAVRAIASCGEGTNDAVARAKRFLAAHADAPVAMRVRAACATQLQKR